MMLEYNYVEPFNMAEELAEFLFYKSKENKLLLVSGKYQSLI